MTRPTFDQIYLAQLDLLGERSTCDRGKPACIITKDDRTLSVGYAGSPPGLPHCDDVGHLMEWRSIYEPSNSNNDLSCIRLTRASKEWNLYAWPVNKVSEHCIRTVHAEANAIAWATRKGIAIEGGTAYVSMTPCRDCAKLLITAGIKRVVAKKDYHASSHSKEMFLLAGVELEIMEK